MTDPRRSVVLVAHGAEWGGTERHVADLAAGLRAEGTEVHVVLSADGPVARRFRDREIATAIVSRTANLPSYLLRMTGALRRLRPRLVHLHSGRWPALAARSAGVPCVLETRHGLERDSPGDRRKPSLLEEFRGDVSSRWIDGTIAVCRSDAREIRLAGGRAKVYCVPNGVVPPPADPRPQPARGAEGAEAGALRLGFLGRLTRQKGLEFLFKALAREGRPWRLEIAGTGEGEAPLRGLAARLGLTDRVDFLGFVDEPGRVFASWDLVVIPSLWEGLPYAALEALAAGRPLLATRVGGMGELIREGEWGWLAAPGDATSLRDAFSRVPWDPLRLARMGQRGRRHLAEYYTADRMLKRVLSVYEDACRPLSRNHRGIG